MMDSLVIDFVLPIKCDMKTLARKFLPLETLVGDSLLLATGPIQIWVNN